MSATAAIAAKPVRVRDGCMRFPAWRPGHPHGFRPNRGRSFRWGPNQIIGPASTPTLPPDRRQIAFRPPLYLSILCIVKYLGYKPRRAPARRADRGKRFSTEIHSMTDSSAVATNPTIPVRGGWPWRIALVAILTAFADWLFFRQVVGVSLALFVLAVGAGVVLANRIEAQPPRAHDLLRHSRRCPSAKPRRFQRHVRADCRVRHRLFRARRDRDAREAT